jgi:hypothetical protein
VSNPSVSDSQEDAPLAQHGGDLDEMAQGPAKSIEPPHHERIAGLERGEGFGEHGARGVGARRLRTRQTKPEMRGLAGCAGCERVRGHRRRLIHRLKKSTAPARGTGARKVCVSFVQAIRAGMFIRVNALGMSASAHKPSRHQAATAR